LENLKIKINGNILTEKSQVIVYIANLNKYYFDAPSLVNILSQKERLRAQSFSTGILTSKYIISHGLLRYILSHHVQYSPENIEFVTNCYGKPFIKDSNIQFSMSHSNEMVCYLISLSKMVGIDIQFHQPNINLIQSLYDQISTPHEKHHFKSLNWQQKMILFYNIWTQKEAILKSLGIGSNFLTKQFFPTYQHVLKDILYKTQQYKIYKYPLVLDDNYSGTIAMSNPIDNINYLIL